MAQLGNGNAVGIIKTAAVHYYKIHFTVSAQTYAGTGFYGKVRLCEDRIVLYQHGASSQCVFKFILQRSKIFAVADEQLAVFPHAQESTAAVVGPGGFKHLAVPDQDAARLTGGGVKKVRVHRAQ